MLKYARILIAMTKKEKKAQNKYDLKKVIEENKVFKHRIDELFSKKYRQSVRYENDVVQDDGKAYINVDLTKIESPFSEFSYNRRMNPEIYDYINNEVFFLRASIPVVINFDDGGAYSEELKEKIRKTVIRHYTLEYEDCRYVYRRNQGLGILFLSIGILLMAVYIILNLTVLHDITSLALEPLYLLSWVFTWESVNRFLFSGQERKIDVYNAGQLALAEVQFGKPVRRPTTPPKGQEKK